MDANELKPCPFCSSTEATQDAWSVKCLECGAEMPGDVARAREAWNRRGVPVRFNSKEADAVIDALNRVLAGEWQEGDLPIKSYESALEKLS